jgi:hypothetical protein
MHHPEGLVVWFGSLMARSPTARKRKPLRGLAGRGLGDERRNVKDVPSTGTTPPGVKAETRQTPAHPFGASALVVDQHIGGMRVHRTNLF